VNAAFDVSGQMEPRDVRVGSAIRPDFLADSGDASTSALPDGLPMKKNSSVPPPSFR